MLQVTISSESKVGCLRSHYRLASHLSYDGVQVGPRVSAEDQPIQETVKGALLVLQ